MPISYLNNIPTCRPLSLSDSDIAPRPLDWAVLPTVALSALVRPALLVLALLALQHRLQSALDVPDLLVHLHLFSQVLIGFLPYLPGKVSRFPVQLSGFALDTSLHFLPRQVQLLSQLSIVLT